MKKFMTRITAAALALAVCVGGAAAADGVSRLHTSSLQLTDTAALTAGKFLQPNGTGTTEQRETVVEYRPEETVKPEVAFGTTLYGRSTMDYVKQYLKDRGKTVVAGINGSFFEMATGIPIGCVITEGRLRASGNAQSVGFRADGSAVIGQPGITVTVTYPNGQTSAVHYNKQLTKSNGPVLYSRDYDARTKNSINGYHVVLEPEKPALGLTDTITARVSKIVKDAKSCDIPEGGMVLAVASDTNFAATMATRLFALQEGDAITIETSCAEAWRDVVSGCGGDELLVKDGTAVREFRLDSADRTTARSAVGLKADGTLVLYTVDGLQAGAMGLTLPQLAQRMQQLGCQTALNLDGGGSTALGARYPGQQEAAAVTSPSDGSLRRCANFIFLTQQTRPAGEAAGIYLYPYDALTVAGGQVPFTVLAADERYTACEVPEGVGYSAQNGTVTDGGVFTADKPGQASVTASAAGMSSTRAVTVLQGPSSVKLLNQKTGKTVASVTVSSRNQMDLTASASYYGLPVYTGDRLYTWQASEGIGTIDADGVFTAVQTEKDVTGTITVSMGQLKLSLPVTVKGVPLTGRTVHGFEAEDPGCTASGVGVRASVNREADKVRYGRQSLRVDYDFGAVEAVNEGARTVTVQTSRALETGDRTLGLWVLGDGSGTRLLARLSTGSKSQTAELAELDFTGWRYVTAEIPEGEKTLTGFVLEQGTNGLSTGTLYLDQATAGNGVLQDVTPPAITMTKTEKTLEIAVSDTGSGVETLRLLVDGKQMDAGWKDGKASFPLPEDGGYHKITVKAADRYGNLAMASEQTGQAPEAGFADTKGHWAQGPIAYLSGQGILNGSKNEKGQLCYRPDDSMTRQEFVTALIRWLGADTAEYGQVRLPYADEAAIAPWAREAMKAAYALGLMTGSAAGNGQVLARPAGTITRQEAMTILGRTQEKGYPAADLAGFSDQAGVAAWAREQIAVMVGQGVISGAGGRLSPQGNVTRAQVAKMLYQLQ